MLLEQYTLILRHELVAGERGEERIEIEPPLCVEYSTDRAHSSGAGVILDRMMDEFKRHILERVAKGAEA